MAGFMVGQGFASEQSGPADSRTFEALLDEVRQLRQDLRSTNAAVMSAQLLLYRLQSQNAAVAQAQRRVDEIRQKTAEARAKQIDLQGATKHVEDVVSRQSGNNEAERKDMEDQLPLLKSSLEAVDTDWQKLQVLEIEADDQFRKEQLKLKELEDRLDCVETEFSGSEQHPR